MKTATLFTVFLGCITITVGLAVSGCGDKSDEVSRAAGDEINLGQVCTDACTTFLICVQEEIGQEFPPETLEEYLSGCQGDCVNPGDDPEDIRKIDCVLDCDVSADCATFLQCVCDCDSGAYDGCS